MSATSSRTNAPNPCGRANVRSCHAGCSAAFARAAVAPLTPVAHLGRSATYTRSMKPRFTIPAWLRPERTIIVFAWACTAVFVPACIFIGVQTLRATHRAAQVSRLQPGTTQQQVLAVVGRPTYESDDRSSWYYTADFRGALRLPLVGPDDLYVEFSPDGRVTHTGVMDD